ncbi:hypothetical protein ACIBBB_32510 [Streptomyces sp. NPDC051217]|uniref:hypothetical protein n=1 Tax=Streptomyces sp. NPDC051217 TaxID=3365644 RepID=UPI0037B4251D
MAELEKGTRRANGESAIYLGKDGRWHARVPMGYKDNGSRTADMRRARRARNWLTRSGG